jgi:hypothetical protein
MLYTDRGLAVGGFERKLRRGIRRYTNLASLTLRTVLYQRPPPGMCSPKKINHYRLALCKPGFDTITEQDEPVSTLEGYRLLPLIASAELIPSHLSIKKRNSYGWVSDHRDCFSTSPGQPAFRGDKRLWKPPLAFARHRLVVKVADRIVILDSVQSSSPHSTCPCRLDC